MNIKKLMKKLACLGLCTTIVVTNTPSWQSDVANAAAVVYRNKTTTVSFNDKKGFKKVTVNGKKKSIKLGVKKFKITFSKEGLYTVKVTNKKNKSSVKKVCIDKTTPTISGAENGQNYTQPVSLSVSDKYGVKSFTVNEQQINSPFKVTVKGSGSYKAVALDKAGNKTEISFTIGSEQKPTDVPVQTASASSVGTTPTSTVEATKVPNTTEVVNSTGTPVVTGAPKVTEVAKTATPIESELPKVTKEPVEVEVEVTVAPNLPENTPAPTKEPEKQCDHVWQLVSTAKEPTCYSYGTGQYVCETCSGTKDDVIEKLPHKFTKQVEDKSCCVKEVTCTESGQYHLVCEDCGAVDENITEVKPSGHRFEKKIASEKYLKDPATEEHGSTYFLACVSCEEKGTDEYTWNDNSPLAHTHHKFTDTSIVSDENLASPADCTSPAKYFYKCSECDTFSTTDTFEVGNPLNHEFSVANECAEVQIEAPTCSKPGKYYFTCSRCGLSAKSIDESKVFTGQKTSEHTFDAQVADDNKYYHSESTCQAGTEYYVSCSVCGKSSKGFPQESFFRGTDVASCAYELRIDAFKARRTCQHGEQHFKGCKWCGRSSESEYNNLIKSGKTDRELGHLFFDDGQRADHNWECSVRSDRLRTELSCVSPRTFWKTCVWCDQSSEKLGADYFVSQQALGHDFTDNGRNHYETKAATLTEDSHYQLVCNRANCNDRDGQDHVAKNSHLDTYDPLVRWEFTTNVSNKQTTSVGTDSGNNYYNYSVKHTDSDTGGVLEIRIADDATRVLNGVRLASGVKVARLYITSYAGNYVDEVAKGGSPGLASSLVDLTVANGAAYYKNNLDFSSIRNDPSYHYYVYIYVMDYANNVTCIRLPDLYI